MKLMIRPMRVPPLLTPVGLRRSCPRCLPLQPYLLPLTAFGRTLDRIEHRVVLDAVAEIRLGQAITLKAGKEIVNRVHEGVLVAKNVSRRPPRRDVRVDVFRHQNCLISLLRLRLSAVIELELIQAFEIESHAALAAVDLERVVVTAS